MDVSGWRTAFLHDYSWTQAPLSHVPTVPWASEFTDGSCESRWQMGEVREQEGSCGRFSWARPGMTCATSAHIPLARNVTWPHLGIREVRKCSLTMCPGGKGNGFGEQLASVWHNQNITFSIIL